MPHTIPGLEAREGKDPSRHPLKKHKKGPPRACQHKSSQASELSAKVHVERGCPPPPMETTRVLAECILELLDYVTKHSDDSSELNDAIKWRLEEVIRGS